MKVAVNDSAPLGKQYGNKYLEKLYNIWTELHMEMDVFGIFCICKFDFAKPKSFSTSFWTKDFYIIYTKIMKRKL